MLPMDGKSDLKPTTGLHATIREDLWIMKNDVYSRKVEINIRDAEERSRGISPFRP
jgi:hypothetical protein